MKTLKLLLVCLLTLIATALSFVVSSSSAQAGLLFSDSLSYPTGPLAGDGPPPGSPPGQGPWVNFNGGPFVTPYGLHYPGFRAPGKAVILRDFGDNGGAIGATVGPIPGGSGTVWVGWLTRQQAGEGGGYAVVTFNEGVGATSPGFGVLFESNLFGIDNDTGASHSQAFTTVSPGSDTVWLVAELDFTTGTETLFVNPSLSGGAIVAEGTAHLAMSAEFQAGGFSEIIFKEGFYNGAYTFDELRVGDTFRDISR